MAESISPFPPSQGAPKNKQRLGELLIEAGLVTQTQVDMGLREQKKRGGLIGDILVQLGFVAPEVLADFLAASAFLTGPRAGEANASWPTDAEAA